MSCHQELLLDLNSDCAEFCTSFDHADWLAVGTYELDESSRTRDGRLYLYSLVRTEQKQPWHPQLQELATLDVPGIFDLQWSQIDAISGSPCLGLALADGTLRMVAIQQNSPESNDVLQDSHQDAEQQPGRTMLQEVCSCKAVEGMALALDWCQQDEMLQQHLAAVSSSTGTISVMQVQDGGLQQLCEWTGHELEAWMAHWDKHQPHVLYSGADDCTFKAWDIRAALGSSCAGGSESQEPPHQIPIFSNRKAHSAGVCCISSHPRKEHTLVTGSYDENLRLWDVRMIQRPVESCQDACWCVAVAAVCGVPYICCNECKVQQPEVVLPVLLLQVATGGGVWRLKWHPQHDRLLLAACMYNGFAIVSADEAWGTLQVAEEYKGHESIAYGADWYRGRLYSSSTAAHGSAAVEAAAAQLERAVLHDTQQQQRQDVIATCSFYDRRLHLWSPKTV